MIAFQLIDVQTGEVIISSKVDNLTELEKETKKEIKNLEIKDLKIEINKYEIIIFTNDGEYVASSQNIDFKNKKVDQIPIYYAGL